MQTDMHTYVCARTDIYLYDNCYISLQLFLMRVVYKDMLKKISYVSIIYNPDI